MPHASFLRRPAVLAALLGLASVLAATTGSVTGVLAGERRPVPAVTIYPGDVIHDAMIADADFPDAVPSNLFAGNRAALVGKVARRTLLPGQAIPVNALGEPKLVTIGMRVRLVFQEDGLVISTYASALQAGAAGDFVTVRNLESGIVIGGTIGPDGSVHVSGS